MAYTKKGLVFSSMKVEIENVKGQHKKECNACGARPEKRRLFVKKGSGRSQKQEVYCIQCGTGWLQDREEELQRAALFLNMNHDDIEKQGVRVPVDSLRVPPVKPEIKPPTTSAAPKAKTTFRKFFK